MNAFTELLKKKRKEAGLTQQQVAEKMNVTVNSVQNWESGKNSVDYSRLDNLAYIYNMPVEELIREKLRDKNHKRKDNWPSFLFKGDTNAIVRSLHLNLNQQDLFGLLYIYDSEYLKKTMMDSDTLKDDLKIVPYDFISKVGSIQFMNIADGLRRVLRYVQTDFMLKVLRLNPEEEFDICRMNKDLICEFIDTGYKRLDEFDVGMYEFYEDLSGEALHFHISMNRAKTILPLLEKAPIHLTNDWWAEPPILENIPEEMLSACGFKPDLLKEGYYKNGFNTLGLTSGLDGIAEYHAVKTEGQSDKWILEITEKGRLLLNWFNEKE